MESKKTTETKIILRMSECEAEWLKGVMQNPLFVEHPGDEDLNDNAMRLQLWEALSNV